MTTKYWICLVLISLSSAGFGAEQFGRFTYRVVGETIEIIDYPKDLPGEVEIPAEIDGKPVTAITGLGDPDEFDGAFAFSEISSVTIPDSVTTIGNEAFGACFNLTSVTIPDSVTHIGDSAFYQSNGITSVAIGSSVTSIGEFAFFKCFRLISLRLPDSVASIGDFAFEGCRALTSLSLGSGLNSIGTSGFARCSKLTSVTIPAGVTFMDNNCFVLCDSLRAAIFLGAAPTAPANLFDDSVPGFSVHFISGSTGFTAPTWRGLPAQELELAPSASQAWLLGHGFPIGTDLQQDVDGDGVTLLMSYALNLDPNEAPLRELPTAVLGSSALSISFFAGREELTYTVQSSADLQTWTPEGVSVSEVGPGGRRTASIGLGRGSQFLRLLVRE